MTWGGLLIAVLLAGCASNPDQTIFIMSPPVSGNGGARGAPGGLALLVRPVVLPDYLDTTDLITRTGPFDVVASRTGRWGERLSQGITRTLAADLSHRLSAYAVGDGAATAPALQIEVKVSAFDVTAGAGRAGRKLDGRLA